MLLPFPSEEKPAVEENGEVAPDNIPAYTTPEYTPTGGHRIVEGQGGSLRRCAVSRFFPEMKARGDLIDAAEDLLDDLRGQGFSFRTADGQLSVSPASKLTPALGASIMAAKEYLLLILRQENELLEPSPQKRGRRV
jgi:hypothetical protein